MSLEILGARIDTVTIEQAREKVRGFLHYGGQHTIFTPNPEMLVMAHKYIDFRDVLNRGSLNLCDGKGIEIASRGKLKRIPGVDFMLDICKIAEEEGKSVYLLGTRHHDILDKTSKALKKMFPQLNTVGSHSGNNVTMKQCNNETMLELDKDANDRVIADINLTRTDILFVAFGHGKQELWIDKYLKELPSVKIAMGVGGAFDFISGKVPRAPRLLRKLGLEWVWRLIVQPWRWKRIWDAVIMFPFIILIEHGLNESNE